jgi:hypothetical protein
MTAAANAAQPGVSLEVFEALTINSEVSRRTECLYHTAIVRALEALGRGDTAAASLILDDCLTSPRDGMIRDVYEFVTRRPGGSAWTGGTA